MRGSKFHLLHSWPQAIAHIDGDAFFASVEQAINPELKGKPIVTGAERGVVTAASYEAKALGIKRGTPISEVPYLSPKCTIVSSNYENYGLFSKKMFAIMRRFSPLIEEYSIDEGFIDLTGLRRTYHTSYEKIAAKIKETIEQELGITVSLGLSLSKSLAKLCSKYQKPSGLIIRPGRSIHLLLKETSLEQVWGFGKNSVALLEKKGLKNAYDFINTPERNIHQWMGKIGSELWRELRGEAVYPVDPELKRSYHSISKTKTFYPPSQDPDYLYAQALRNLERASAKARRFNLKATKLVLLLKKQTFQTTALEAKLSRATASPLELTEVLKKLFSSLYQSGKDYRSTGIVLSGLQSTDSNQLGLFEDPLKLLQVERLYQGIDHINNRYGRNTVYLGDGLTVARHSKIKEKAPFHKELSLPKLAYSTI